MITLYTNDTLPTSVINWQSTYMRSRADAYGTTASFAPFYADECGNLASLLDGHMIFCGNAENIEEWACFLTMQPDIRTFTASKSVIDAVAELLKKQVSYKKIMRLTAVLEQPSIDLYAPSAAEMYPLLSAVFGDTMPAYDGWYVDVSHRIRHGLCHTAGIMADGDLVSSAMTVAESQDAVVIGAVATAESHRKRGYAGQCIRKLANLSAPKTIMISPKNNGAERLYSKMGFEVFDIIGQIQF